MTLIQVIDRARELLNDERLAASRTFPDDTSSFWTDSELMQFHNISQQEIQNEIVNSYEDQFITQTSVNIVNGTAEYNLPSDFMKMRRLEDNRNPENPYEIRPIRMSEKGSYYGTNFGSNTLYGNGYYLRGTQFVLDLTPAFTQASGIRVHYIKRLPDVTSTAGSSEIPAEYHYAIVWGVVRLALFKMQADTTKADGEYEKHLVRMRNYAELRQVQRPRVVGKTKGY